MAWQVSKRVWDHAIKIKLNYKVMLLALADKADENGICWPKFDTSYETLGKMVGGLDRRSAMRLIDNLVEAGHVIKFKTVGRGNSNIFLVITGLTEAEKAKSLALIGDNPVTISNEESEESQEEMVTTFTLNGDNPVTNYGINGDNPVTHPIIENPSIPSGKKKQPPLPGNKKPATQDQLMFLKIAELCQWEVKLMGDKQKGRVKNAKNSLLKFGTDPPQLDEFREWWYAYDWRGLRRQPPTPEQILEEWGRFEKATEKPKVRMSAK